MKKKTNKQISIEYWKRCSIVRFILLLGSTVSNLPTSELDFALHNNCQSNCSFTSHMTFQVGPGKQT